MPIEYFWELGKQDAKVAMESQDEKAYDKTIEKIDSIKEKYDEECATIYAYGMLSVLSPKKEKQR